MTLYIFISGYVSLVRQPGHNSSTSNNPVVALMEWKTCLINIIPVLDVHLEEPSHMMEAEVLTESY